MKPRSWLWMLGMVAMTSVAAAGEAHAADAIRFERDQEVLFLNASDLAASLAWELKIVQPRRLVTFCRDGEGGLCIPVQLTDDNHRRAGDQLMIAADVVRFALRFQVVSTDGRITVTPGPAIDDAKPQHAVPAFNAGWGEGRGFGRGDTLPDIPLVDVDGKEVRFSSFLGQRYILYCWASW